MSDTSAASTPPADLVLHGGVIATLDEDRPRARALAIRGARIVRVGDDAEILALAGPRTRVIDLHGRAVIPALTDAHAHMVGLGLALAEVDLVGCDSEAACAQRVRGKASGSSRWVRGRGWDQNRFPDRRFPSRQALDAVVGDRPAWLTRVDGHAAWVNGRALELAGIDERTPDPPGGRLLRDARGRPTGVLVDAAMGLVGRVMPAPSLEEREQAILRAQDLALSRGLTEVHDMGVDADTVGLYRRLAAPPDNAGSPAGPRLRIRIRAYADGQGAAHRARWIESAPDPARPDALFTLAGIKLFADGALGSRGAALLAPYSDEPQNRGLVLMSVDELTEATRRARAHGWQLAVHAIGDRANRDVLDAFARAGLTAADDHRFRVEHAQVLAPDDIPRFARLGAVASMQPTHATSDMPWAEARLGPERVRGAYAWRSVLRAGGRLAGGSDFPVEEVAPIRGQLHAALTRTDAQGRPPGGWLPDERLGLDEALRMFTTEAAWAAFEEPWRGRAAAGMAADLTVLDRDILVGAPDAIRAAAVDLTIVAGEVVYERR